MLHCVMLTRKALLHCRSKVPRVLPPLLQGRDGSLGPAPNGTHGKRRVVRKLSFSAEKDDQAAGRKRKATASPSSTEDESGSGSRESRESRGTEVSSASVFRCALGLRLSVPLWRILFEASWYCLRQCGITLKNADDKGKTSQQ